LDGDSLQLWVLESAARGNLLALALITLETPLPSELHTDIVNKRRRLPHHLLPQLMAQSANTVSALEHSYARVIRISVSERHRRLGLGSALLSLIEENLLSAENDTAVDAIGASFANEISSHSFWKANDYTVFHEGFRKNPRTGKHAVAVLKTLDQDLTMVLKKAQDIYLDNTAHSDKDTTAISPTIEKTAERFDNEILRQFALGHRSLHDSQAAVHRYAHANNVSIVQEQGVTRKTYEATLRQQGVLRIKLKVTQRLQSNSCPTSVRPNRNPVSQ